MANYNSFLLLSGFPNYAWWLNKKSLHCMIWFSTYAEEIFKTIINGREQETLRTQQHVSVILAQNAWLQSNHEKTSDRLKLKNWPVLLQSIKVIKDRKTVSDWNSLKEISQPNPPWDPKFLKFLLLLKKAVLRKLLIVDCIKCTNFKGTAWWFFYI